MKIFLSFSLFLFLLCAETSAKKNSGATGSEGFGVIKGFVVDSATNTGMAYATVSVIDTKTSKVVDGALSKDKGEFVVDGLPVGEYNIRFSFMGYRTETIASVNLTKENPRIDLSYVKLKTTYIETQAVEVNADKNSVTYKLDKRIINISENPNVHGGRIADALQNIPSISVDVEGKVTLRGSPNFQVLIDGKPSPMNGNDALRMIPADAVENIELITNPTAKYDPDGTAGIINIVMKKMDMNGLNGIVNASAGIKDKYSADGLINYKFKKMNFYTGLEYEDMTYKPWSDYTRETYSQSTDTVFLINPIINRTMQDKSFSAKAGIEYTIDPSRFVSFSGNVINMDFKRSMPSKLKVWTNPLNVYEYFINNDDFTIKGYYSTINSYFLQNFDKNGHQFSATVNAIIWDGAGNEISSKVLTNNNFVINDTNPQKHQGIADSKSFMIKCKADYSYPFGEGYNLEAGYNFDYTQDFSDYLYQDFNIVRSYWDKNLNYTNNTKYYHSINAVYSTFAGLLFDFNYQIGLRAEYFNRRLTQETDNSLFKYEKVNIFPTFHLSRKFEGDQQVQLSYSRRVQRPDVYALNPFPDYADDYYVSVGNPNLMPEFTDSYELNYQKGFENLFLSLQTYYRNTDNAISRVLRLKDDNKIYITSENISRKYVFGAELSANFSISKAFRINFNGNFFYNKLETTNPIIQENLSGTAFDGNVMVFYNLGQNTLMQLNSFFFGPRYSIDGNIKETYAFGFSIRQFLYNRNLTIYLNARNVLNSMKYESVNRRGNYYNYGTMFTDGVNVSLGISLKINNFEKKIRPEDRIERTNVGSSGGY